MNPSADATHASYYGRVFYDAKCGLCQAGVKRGGLFQRRGFRYQPLQTPGLAAELGLPEAELYREMKVQLADGKVFGGVDAWSALLRSIWWLWPIGTLLRIPGLHWIADRIYRWIAAHRYQISGHCPLPEAPPRNDP
jgi:predicted DCC family thiol-disulfide oxidoreductase YuxK